MDLRVIDQAGALSQKFYQLAILCPVEEDRIRAQVVQAESCGSRNRPLSESWRIAHFAPEVLEQVAMGRNGHQDFCR